MARKASENKTGVAEQATAAEEKTTAAESAVPATENDKQTSADSAIENTGDTGVDNETVTADNEAEEKTTDSETGDTSGETDGTDDEADDISGEEKQQPDAGKGVRFNVAPDGLVEVISEKRAGKSVTGATGDIITFDDKGYAKVKLEDAVHFSQVPGFSFK